MKTYHIIAVNLLEKKELTISNANVKPFRDWLIKGGSRCLPNGDVVTSKGSKVVFMATDKPKKVRVKLEEETA